MVAGGDEPRPDGGDSTAYQPGWMCTDQPIHRISTRMDVYRSTDPPHINPDGCVPIHRRGGVYPRPNPTSHIKNMWPGGNGMITVVGVRAGINPAPTDPHRTAVLMVTPPRRWILFFPIGIISYSMHPY